jgi:hypothetical protein
MTSIAAVNVVTVSPGARVTSRTVSPSASPVNPSAVAIDSAAVITQSYANEDQLVGASP